MALISTGLGRPLRASQTLDRVVASIGNLAVTEADVEDEYRFEMFLDGKLPLAAPDRATMSRVRDRLIEQRLLAEEAKTETTEVAGADAGLSETWRDLHQKFGSQEAFDAALRSLGMEEEQVRARIAAQQNTLRTIEQLFRPSAGPESAEIESYYRDVLLPEFAQHSQSPPPRLADVENEIREILIEKKINEQLEKWLGEMKSNRRVKLHAF